MGGKVKIGGGEKIKNNDVRQKRIIIFFPLKIKKIIDETVSL